jgi:hypothetical protein
MFSKSRRNLGTRTNGSLDMQILNNQSIINKNLTKNLLKTHPSHRKRRVIERQRRTPESSGISTKSPSTTLMNITKKSLVVKIKEKESNTNSESNSKNNSKRNIIDADPISTVATATIQPEEQGDPKEGERLFNSQMWVKGNPLHFYC